MNKAKCFIWLHGIIQVSFGLLLVLLAFKKYYGSIEVMSFLKINLAFFVFFLFILVKESFQSNVSYKARTFLSKRGLVII